MSDSPPVRPAEPFPPAPAWFTPQAALLLLLAGAAWLLTIGVAADMANGPGTMGLGLLGFLGPWTAMMSAMMLPAVAPVAAAYTRTVVTSRGPRLVAFVAGYLVVWAAAGLPAYLLLRLTGALAEAHGSGARAAAAVILVGAGAWELSPFKDRCLAHCRSPFALLLRIGSYRGRWRDVRAALYHGGYCLGCCWALMTLLAVFGAMNLVAMVVLAAVVVAQKSLPRGDRLVRPVAVACLVLAAVVLAWPVVAPGLNGDAPPMHHMP